MILPHVESWFSCLVFFIFFVFFSESRLWRSNGAEL